MSAKTTGQESAEEARSACNNLPPEEKARLTDVALTAIHERDRILAQRDWAMRIADEALGNGHASHCTYEEGKYRCRCGVLQLQEELRQLRAEIG